MWKGIYNRDLGEDNTYSSVKHMSKETYTCERKLMKLKETYRCEKRPIDAKRDILQRHKDVKRDLQKRPIDVKRDLQKRPGSRYL